MSTGERLTKLGLPRVELGIGGARDDDHGGVFGAEVAQVGDVFAWIC